MKTSTNFTFLILMIGFCACQKKEVKSLDIAEEKAKINFNQQYINIEIDTSIFGTVLSNNRFITLKSDGEFICLKPSNFEFDTLAAEKLNKKKCSSFYQMYDSLVVVENNKDFYVNSEFEFIPYNRYKNPIYKSDTSITYDLKQKFIDPLYCDSNFIITQFCAGEFGGTLYFFDLKNNKEYFYPATCASAVNKIKGKYIITISLAHMVGSSEVLEITDPYSLSEIDFDTVKYWANFWEKSIWDGRSRSRYDSLINIMRGDNNQLLDSTGIFIYSSFKYQDEIYHIFRSERNFTNPKSYQNTFIGKIVDNRIIILDSLKRKDLFSYKPQNRVYKDWTIYSYNHRSKNMGFMAIQDTNINLVEYTIRK